MYKSFVACFQSQNFQKPLYWPTGVQRLYTRVGSTSGIYVTWYPIHTTAHPPLQAHCHYVVLKGFHTAIQSAELCPGNHTLMMALCALFAVFGITENSGEFQLVSWGTGVAIALSLGFLQRNKAFKSLWKAWRWGYHNSVYIQSASRPYIAEGFNYSSYIALLYM